jgi:cell wall-associated NlpC family hydrolase
MGSARRTGVIIAMSSGLVASMALPAHAVTAAPPESAAGPQTASIPVVPASNGTSFFTAPQGGLLSLPTDLATDDETVAAPVAASVDFGGSTFTVVPVHRTDTSTQQAPSTRRAIRLANTVTTDTTKSADSSTGTSTSEAPSTSGSSAVAIAMRYKGVPYRWGGTSPAGFDCSGLVQYVYKQLGVSLPRTVADQHGAVKIIPRSQARAGDLVFFPGLGHMGIYLGGNKMIDAPHSGSVVQVCDIYSAGVSFGRV